MGAALGLVLCLSGCGGEGEDDLVEVERPGDLFQVVDRSDRPLGQAAVVRVTQEWIVALTALPSGKPLTPGQAAPARYLKVGDERLPAVVRDCGGGLAVIQVRRGDRKARPFGLLYELSVDLGVQIRGVTGDQLSTRLVSETGGGFKIREGAPWSGGVVLRGARLIGFMIGAKEASPRLVRISASLARCLPVVCSAPGSDALGPDDGFSALELALRSPPTLPPLEDDWGDADFFLALDDQEEGTALARLHLVPGRHLRPQLITTPNLGPLQARLVERDVSLTEGVVDTPLAPVQLLDPRSGAARLRFELLDGALVALGLRLRVLDPDRASGLDRTPLGAKPVRLSDAKRGKLSLTGGDATDLWRFEALPLSRAPTEPVQVSKDLLLLAFRADPSLVTLEGWLPGSAGPSWRLASGEGAPRLVALRLDVQGVRQWIRARQDRVRSPEDPKLGIPSTYAFAAALRTKPKVLAGLLLELLVGEARREGATYLSAPALARETLRALNEVGGASRPDLTEAFLPGLGHPEPAARLLVLELLSAYLAPDEVALERLRREARGAARRTDAGLLLVSRLRSPRRLAEVELALRLEDLAEEDPSREEASDLEDPLERRAAEVARVWRTLPSSERDALVRAASDAMGAFLLRGASDALPEIRVRAIALAASVKDPALRLRLRERLEARLHQDPSPRVRRALLTAFWSRD
jgi:hypothetical protein